MLETMRKGDGHTADRLRREAATIGALDIAGLPAVVSLEDVGEGACELTTAVPPGTPLRDKAPVPPEEAAGIVLAIAAIARQLADAGVRRDPFQADQVHLAGGTRPMLRHVAGAHTGNKAPVEPGAGDLGRLLHILLAPQGRRPRWALRDDPANALRRVAHRAADPALRLDHFTALVREAAPGAHLPQPTASRKPEGRSSPGAVVRRVITATALVFAGAVGVALSVDGSGRNTADGDLAQPSADPSTPATATAADPTAVETEAEAVWPRYGCPVQDGVKIEVEGERCPLAAIAAGTTIDAGSHAWQVRGEGTYVTALGDWDCNGRTAVAALDLDTGDVWMFTALAATDAPATATYVGRAVGAVALPPPDGCGLMSALDAAGNRVVVEPAREEVEP